MRAIVWRTIFLGLLLFWSIVIWSAVSWLGNIGGDYWLRLSKPETVKCSPALLKLT